MRGALSSARLGPIFQRFAVFAALTSGVIPVTSFLPPLAPYPQTRLRRNRRDAWSRKLVAETILTAGDLIWPVFVQDEGHKEPTPSMPEVFRLPIPALVDAAGEAAGLGIPVVAVFPAVPPALKDADGSNALDPGNLVCRAVTALKEALPELGVLCDVALDPFTSHGHDGVIRDGYVENDETVEILRQQAVIQARAGCDIIASSDMMDDARGVLPAGFICRRDRPPPWLRPQADRGGGRSRRPTRLSSPLLD